MIPEFTKAGVALTLSIWESGSLSPYFPRRGPKILVVLSLYLFILYRFMCAIRGVSGSGD